MTSSIDSGTQERLALVTGTSAGIGAAIAGALLQEKWTVIGVSRRAVTFDSAAYRHHVFDLGDSAALKSFAEDTLKPILTAKRWRRIALVNNAAVLGELRGLKEADPVSLTRVFKINAVAPIFLMGWLTGVAPPQAQLRIANISSGAATQGIAGLGDYCASKAALRLAGLALAAELERGAPSGRRPDTTSILSYEPGVVATNMQDQARATDPAAFPSHQVFQEFAASGALQPPAAVVGEVVTFLAGDEAAYFTERRFGGS